MDPSLASTIRNTESMIDALNKKVNSVGGGKSGNPFQSMIPDQKAFDAALKNSQKFSSILDRRRISESRGSVHLSTLPDGTAPSNQPRLQAGPETGHAGRFHVPHYTHHDLDHRHWLRIRNLVSCSVPHYRYRVSRKAEEVLKIQSWIASCS
jgi:hypothetical protein